METLMVEPKAVPMGDYEVVAMAFRSVAQMDY